MSQRGNTNFLFISLYMLLLAFFIMLVAFSSFQEKKTKRVVSAVRNQFIEQTFADTTTPAPIINDLASAEVPLDKLLEETFRDTFRVFTPKSIARGNGYSFDVPVAELFADGAAQVLNEKIAFATRIVAGLNRPSPNKDHTLEILLPTGNTDGESALNILRAGELARLFVLYGLPKDKIAVGMAPKLKDVNFSVYALDQSRAKVDFGFLRPAAATDAPPSP